MTPTVRASVMRLAGGAALASALGAAATAGVVPWPVWVLAALAGIGGAWRPEMTVPALLLVVPWGERLAGVPVRATEIIFTAFLAGWCLRISEAQPPSPDPAPGIGRAMWLLAAIVLLSWARVVFDVPAGYGMPTAGLVPVDYLVTAGRDPHTAAAVQWLLALACLALVRRLARRDPLLPGRALTAVALSGVIAAVASIVAVPVIYYMTGDYNEIDRYIGNTPSRGSFHLGDVNAAGSHYILAGIAALGVRSASTRRHHAWLAGIVAIVVGLWMSGSRAAVVSGVVFAAAWLGLTQAGVKTWPRLSPRTLGTVAVSALVLLTLSARLGSATAETGSASRSLSIRGEFLETSLGMWKTAPVTGVGVGTYYSRSSAFMPPGIRAIYGRENAHNFFLQVMAELGLVGLASYLWLLGVALGVSWAGLRFGTQGPPCAAFLACGAYLLTSVTGHPFLVVEAALPFWAMLALASSPWPAPSRP